MTTKSELLRVAAAMEALANNIPNGTGVLNSPYHYEAMVKQTRDAMQDLCFAAQDGIDALARNLQEHLPYGDYNPTAYTNHAVKDAVIDFIEGDFPDTDAFFEEVA